MLVTQHTGDVATVIEGAVARVLIDRPEARNALSPAVVAGIVAAVDAAAGAGCSVLVIRGAGGTLSAGADLKHLRAIAHDPAAVRGYIASIGGMTGLIADAPFVTVAVASEYALAGGLEILLACDLAVVSEQAQLGDRHLQYGLLPGAGGSVRLARAAPAAVARRLLYTGEMIDGASAARAGLVSHAVPAGQLDAEVEALVARLAGHSRSALRKMRSCTGWPRRAGRTWRWPPSGRRCCGTWAATATWPRGWPRSPNGARRTSRSSPATVRHRRSRRR